jgi:hypothetical protein
MKKQEIEKKIEASLSSLDHVTRVGPGPFFYTRLQARLRKDRTVWEKASGFIAQPAVAFSVICLIISLNTFVIFKTETSSTSSFIEQKNSILSDDSDSDVFAFYDEENNNTDAQ